MKILPTVVLSLGLMSGTTAGAVDTDAVIGGAIGGGVGAAVGSELGGRSGAIAGSAVGAAVGTAITTDGDGGDGHREGVYYDDGYPGGPPAHAYREPPGHTKHNKHKH